MPPNFLRVVGEQLEEPRLRRRLARVVGVGELDADGAHDGHLLLAGGLRREPVRFQRPSSQSFAADSLRSDL